MTGCLCRKIHPTSPFPGAMVTSCTLGSLSAGVIRQEKDGTVRVEGGSYESQERVVIIVKRCHENLFQG